MITRKKSRRQTDRSAPKSDSSLPVLLHVIGQLIPDSSQRRLSYEDAIGWFVDHRPPQQSAAQGAILRTPCLTEEPRVQDFLDARHQLVCDPNGTPHGRRFVVKELGEELTEAFRGTRLPAS
ncbi:hypothetical protein [Sphaerisporangium sp. NPDC051011]|uniref:hypothetical protein n=1 Tax=Sphaerisporangium sp. NPDC051011 TaxID=3155792 RepID=UPI0033FC64C9